MDETYIKVRGKQSSLHRAVDTNGIPERIVTDKSSANLAGLQSLNIILEFTDFGRTISIVQSKYLDDIIQGTIARLTHFGRWKVNKWCLRWAFIVPAQMATKVRPLGYT